MELTDEQREKFLEYVRSGMNRQQAAEEVGSTGTRFRFLCRREPAFNLLYEEAKREGQGEMVDRLERCAFELAVGGHWPALKFMLTTYGEQFSWARSSKVELGGSVEVSAIAGILSRYLPPAMYDELMNVVEQKMIEENSAAA